MKYDEDKEARKTYRTADGGFCVEWIKAKFLIKGGKRFIFSENDSLENNLFQIRMLRAQYSPTWSHAVSKVLFFDSSEREFYDSILRFMMAFIGDRG